MSRGESAVDVNACRVLFSVNGFIYVPLYHHIFIPLIALAGGCFQSDVTRWIDDTLELYLRRCIFA